MNEPRKFTINVFCPTFTDLKFSGDLLLDNLNRHINKVKIDVKREYSEIKLHLI